MPHRRPAPPPGALFAALSLLAATAACAPSGSDDSEIGDPSGMELTEDLPSPVERDWADITDGDTLRALVTTNSTSYFVYRGEAMGFEFRLLRAFAEDHDLALDVQVVKDRTELFERLNEGEGDVVAARLVPLEDYREAVDFTRPLYETHAAVVQRSAPPDSADLPEAVDTILEKGRAERYEPMELSVRPVRRPRDLVDAGEVVLPRGSEYFARLVELSDTIEGTIEVVELESAINDEQLVRKVARGEVLLTVSPENVAELREEYFTNIEVRPELGREHPVSWAVRTTSPELRAEIDAWLAENQDEVDAKYQRYFVDREGYRERVESEYLTSETGRLSEYDTLIARNAEEIGWDWRLLASQAFQESKFDAHARSWAGAMGLLQLMPGTARDMGVSDPDDPKQNVEGAVKYLQFLEERWSPRMEAFEERLPFVLASYNAGFGHVEDAQRLTEKMGDDPTSWDDVSYWLLQMSKRKYYSDPVVRFGYVRGLEPVTYVALILERYEHYRQFVTGEPLGGRATEATPQAVGGPEDGEESGR